MIELLAVVVVIFEVEIVVDFVVVIELAILKQIYKYMLIFTVNLQYVPFKFLKLLRLYRLK